jgi:hypothetical protein
MNFIQKLTQDTLNGDWNFSWKYNDGSKTYTFNVPKHYLTGMNFSLEKDPDMVILPNGYGLIYDKNALKTLKDAVDVSLEKTADESVKMYLVGETMTEEQQASEDESKVEQPVEEKSKEKVVNELDKKAKNDK